MTDEIPADAASIQSLILDFVQEELISADSDLGPEDDLLSGELLDSMGILRLATFVDDHFSLGMKPTDFRVENFQTIQALSDYVLATKP